MPRFIVPANISGHNVPGEGTLCVEAEKPSLEVAGVVSGTRAVTEDLGEAVSVALQGSKVVTLAQNPPGPRRRPASRFRRLGEREKWAKKRDLPLAALRDIPQGEEET